MKIYVIETLDRVGNVADELKNYGDVVLLNNRGKDIDAYTEIFSDESEKVLAIAPGEIDWKLPTETLNKIKSLKGIATKSSWAHYIDLDFCRQNNITVTNTPGANSQSVAEYALWMMFSLARKLPLQIRDGFKIAWNTEHTQTEIFGKTMGIVGLGHIGKILAQRGEGLGMNVVYWSKKSRDNSYDYLELDQLMAKSDFVFNCLEVCEKTKGILNRDLLSKLKTSAYFISVLGGMGFGVQNDDYLIEMVKNKSLAGFAVENEHEHEFKAPGTDTGNIFTPGAYAWFTQEAENRTNQIWLENIRGMLLGTPANVVV
ncbi:hypothetical protein KBC89_03980 [Candidatus Woesebacteria bacterium]|nr:hypothetical protein [Candidatus Woesebacteria bacterium]